MALRDISNISAPNRADDKSPPRKIMKQTRLIENIHRNRELELQKVLETKDRTQQELSDLNSELWKIRTDLPEIELELEKLNHQLSELENEYKKKENELAEADRRFDSEIEALKHEFELYRQTVESNFNQSIEKLSQECHDKIESSLESKQQTFNKSKHMLETQCAELEQQLATEQQNHGKELNRLTERRHARLEALNRELNREIQNLSSDKDAYKRAIQTLNERITQVKKLINERETENETLSQQIETSKGKASVFEEKTSDIRGEIQLLKSQLAERSQTLKEKHQTAKEYAEMSVGFKQQLESEELLRRKAHNLLQDLKGNIRVFCRVKPEQPENRFQYQVFDSVESNDGNEQIILTEPANPQQHSFNKSAPKNYRFGFDKVFDQDSTNTEIFDEISQLVQSALDGYNVCIFAYGQTGSGKTYTMSSTQDGIIPRSVGLIFEKCRLAEQTGWNYKVEGQFLEIYNENINDLMTESYLRNLDSVKHEIKHDENTRTTTITELTTVRLTDQDQVAHILNSANRNRATASTNANNRSSRSHSVFIISLQGFNSKTGDTISGKLNLIDLAGSERISHSLVTGDRLKETQSINKSLSSLGDVITSLCNKNQHIPYRNSRLTYLLQHSLGGNSKTLMFVNVSSKLQHFNETLNSLRFATKVNNTQLK
ncbi:hypothetical protein OGAPHI_003412 [Ogataea philodendri]|uniref:Kinesin-like protein n=1 Tax=Ogataea philodendri TaxID=1378263 RepID=A0A9P8P7V6_9ASCO|nr:uncharacterized protein OGAPHI_003412 [Ogataea philodendri]KAH3666962.1 hypothetical protein OGAPHI_003412 [Ogataea philodendri]